MKKVNINKIILPCCLGVVGLLSSCSAFDDFLTVYPTNQITGEVFWEDKTDLESGVAACYKQLTTTAMARRLYLWGEGRSDNVTARTTNNQDLVDIMNVNLQPTNTWYDWASVYKEIGFCNLALAHGPEVVASDASFSEGDWQPVEASLKALRALSYFYLVRTFRDVPLNTTTTDTEEGARVPMPQSSAEEVLSFLINDLEGVKDYGMTNYGNEVDNKGYITKDAVYTILADIYLWRAAKNTSADSVAKYPGQAQQDYQKVVELCDAVIASKLQEFRERRTGDITYYGMTDATLTPLPIIMPNTTGQLQDTPYNEMFGSKNSLESIFEIQFSTTGGYNPIVPYFMGSQNDGSFRAGELQPASFFQDISEQPNDNATAFSKTDLRMYETFRYTGRNSNSTGISNFIKYITTSVTTASPSDITSTNGNVVTYGSLRNYNAFDANYILYRASDVILMKAEALACLYEEGSPELEEAFNLVKAVFDRSNPMINSTLDLRFQDYSTPEDLLALIYRERQREFYSEGKRWFDLVRKAERDGTTENMLGLLSSKFTTNSSSIRAKMATMPSIYNPIYRDEIRVNPLLIQNPVWDDDKTSTRN